MRQFTIECSLCSTSSGCCSTGGCHTHNQSRAALWDSSGGGKISRSGLCFCESSGFRGDSWVRESQSSKDGVNASIVPSSGFGGAAGFSVLKWRI